MGAGVGMSSTLARRFARFAMANRGAGRAVASGGVETRARHTGWKSSDFATHRNLVPVTHRPWHTIPAVGITLNPKGNMHNSRDTPHTMWRRVMSSKTKPPIGESTPIDNENTTTNGSNIESKTNAGINALDPRVDPSQTSPGQSRIVRVANFVARDLLSSRSNAELISKMITHRDMAYLVATREASPFPFVFQSGCKFYENGIFENGNDNAHGANSVSHNKTAGKTADKAHPLCGPCDAASVNAHRLREDNNAKPIACTLTPRECFKTQQYSYFGVWMFLCYCGFVGIHRGVRYIWGFITQEIDKYDTAMIKEYQGKVLGLEGGERIDDVSKRNDDDVSKRNGNERLPTTPPPPTPVKQFLTSYDPFGVHGLNFLTPADTWCALIAATLNFSRSVEIIRTTFLMFAYRKLAWRVVAIATNFKRHRRWM